MGVKVDPVYGAIRTGADRAVPLAAVPLDDLAALKAAMPVPSSETPMPETNSGAAGLEGQKVSAAGHRHPRVTSTTGNQDTHIIAASGLATIAFTQAFDVFPGTVFTEVPPASGTMSAQPASFRVESWIRETMTPAPSGKYIGCVVRAWRGRPLPVMNLLSGVLSLTGINGIIAALTAFDTFAAPATGTTFTCIAVKRSDA